MRWLAPFLLVAVPLAAQEPAAEPPARIGAAAWIDQAGHLDQGPELTVLALESPRRPGLYWRISVLAGAKSGGLGVGSDLWIEETARGPVRLSVGAAGVVDYDDAGSSEPASWVPAVFVSVRW